MRVAVVGATGNLGTSVIRALSAEPQVESILGLARRRPAIKLAKVEWERADVTTDDMAALFADSDVVVHLAWAIQPSRDRELTYRTNVLGSRAVFAAVAKAGVPNLVYSSSVGAYSGTSSTDPVDESWPTEGIPTSFYSRDKAAVEADLDGFEADHPDIRVVRFRPSLIFKREAASGIRRLFFGPFVPGFAFSQRVLRVSPDVTGLKFQAVHSHDVGEAFRLAIVGDAAGAFNLAADPVIDANHLAHILRARKLRINPRLLRAVMSASWRMRLQPSPPGWIDMALEVPVMSARRAKEELGWSPRHDAGAALLDLLQGLRDGDGIKTPPLRSDAGGRFRHREILTGVGARPY